MPAPPLRAAAGLPRWLQAALGILAALLLLLPLTLQAPQRVADSWGTEAGFAGSLEPGAIANHTLALRLPARFEDPALRFVPQRAEVSLRLGPPLAGTPLLAALFDARGQPVPWSDGSLEVVLDPSNPLNAPHGPRTAFLHAGEYLLRVAHGDNASRAYDVRVTMVFPFQARQTGVVVEPLLLLAPGLALAVLAALPTAARALALRGGEQPGEQRGEPPGEPEGPQDPQPPPQPP